MRSSSFCLVVSALGLACATGTADAFTCYMVVDAKEAIVYRDTTTPVDLSDRGIAARDALRRSGRLLMILDTDRCVPVAPVRAAGDASVDEIVAGIRSNVMPYGRGTTGIAAPAASTSRTDGLPPAAPAAVERSLMRGRY